MLLAFELVLTHWFYLYLPWVFPFVLLTLFLQRRAVDADCVTRLGRHGAAALVFVALSATLTSAWDGTAEVSDVPHYDDIGLRVQLGRVPYRDVSFEYPPGALPAIVVPEYLSHTFKGYAQVFAAGMVCAASPGSSSRRSRSPDSAPARAALRLRSQCRPCPPCCWVRCCSPASTCSPPRSPWVLWRPCSPAVTGWEAAPSAWASP